jgi:two-component sensor histidine kinase
MNHRVKNNLQVISSLLDMTCSHTKIPIVQKTLIGARTKIQAISSVHHQLYKNEDVRQIDMGKQIHDLYHNLSMVYASGCKVITEIKVYDVMLSLDQAMPCTLVVNELISNALEHAFVERTKGTFMIHMKQSNQMVCLYVRDDGIGLPPNLNMEKIESLGLKLVQILVTKQLKGEIQVTCTRGTSFAIQFKSWNNLQF